MNQNNKQKKVYIWTAGCQMNEYDSELVRAILKKEDYTFVSDELEADIVMLNTCAIREHAHRKVYGRIHEIKHKRQGKPVKIGILGCMATNLRTDLLENRNLDIDFIAGPDSYKRLPQLIEEALADTRHTTHDTRQKIFDLTLSEFETYSDVYPQREKGVNAWIAVMRGCNNFCTFCVVPYTRGRERSRAVDNIVEEARRLAGEGFKQVTLLGQNVNSYHHDGHDFAYLLNKVSEVDGIERIRFTSPHPKDFPESLLKVLAENPKVCKHVHLPLQAGNNRVLEAMNRTYTKEEFIALARRIRGLHPDMALSTDIIVGFPTETDAEFEETLEVMRQVRFDSAFTFKYSEREGTIAKRKMPDDIPDAIKTERIVRVVELQKEISLEQNRAHIGQTCTGLIELSPLKKDPTRMQARLDNNKIVTLPKTEDTPGSFIDILIREASPHGLRGEAAAVTASARMD